MHVAGGKVKVFLKSSRMGFEVWMREAVSVECHLRASNAVDDRYVSLLLLDAEALTSLELHVAACHHRDAVAAFAADTPRRNNIKISNQGGCTSIMSDVLGHVDI